MQLLPHFSDRRKVPIRFEVNLKIYYKTSNGNRIRNKVITVLTRMNNSWDFSIVEQLFNITLSDVVPPIHWKFEKIL